MKDAEIIKKTNEAKDRFKKKYPYSDISKFDFITNVDVDGEFIGVDIYYKIDETTGYDINSDTFKNNKDWTKYLTINKPYQWPKIWSSSGDIPTFNHLVYPKHAKRKGWGHHEIIDTRFQQFGHLGEPLHNFKVYVSEKDYFLANLPKVTAKWSTGKKLNSNMYDIRKVALDYKKEPYFAMICGMYIASFLSGVSMLNIKDNNTPNLIKSIARYHLYYQTRKFMKNPKLIDKFNVSDVKNYLPIKYIDVESSDKDDDGNEYVIKGAIQLTDHDYYGFIAYESSGLTNIGQELLQESVESYVYSVLGAQAKTRWSIVNKGAKSLQTQQAFRKIVEDTIIQNDTTVMISNMRRSIADTNVILNLAISPGIILIPSKLIILEKPIPGYSNILKTAKSSMRFGVNLKVNFVGVQKTEPKKTHQPDTSISHIDNLDTIVKKEDTTIRETEKPTPVKRGVRSTANLSPSYNGELIALLATSVLSTYLVMKYLV